MLFAPKFSISGLETSIIPIVLDSTSASEIGFTIGRYATLNAGIIT